MSKRREQLESLLAQGFDDPEVYYGIGMEHAGEGADEAALLAFRELTARYPDYVPVYLQAGKVLIRLGRDDEARAAYRSGLEAARRTGDVHAADELAGFLRELDQS